jgi:hypothetical protein
MAGRTAFSRSVGLFTDKVGELRRQALIGLARRTFDAAERQNTAVLGYAPSHQTIVDGRSGAPIEAVKPGGTIVYLFDVGSASLEGAIDEAFALLAQLSPVRSGRFQRSFRLLVNGTQQDAAVLGSTIRLAPADEVQITNLQPYARKLERGWSDQAPNGVFEVAAAMLKQRYGKILNIRFSYEAFPGFEAGRTRGGGALHRAGTKERTRAARYPTIRLSLK